MCAWWVMGQGPSMRALSMTALAPQGVPGRMLESMVRLGPVICWLELRGLPVRAAVRVWQVTLRVSKGLLV